MLNLNKVDDQNRRSFQALLAALFFFVCLSGETQAQPPPPKISGEIQTSDETYRIGSGDVIDVVVARNETLSRNGVRVNNDGKIQLPMLEENIAAACLTERELADLLKAKYRKYLLNPHVYVAIKEFNSQPVALIGAVNAPGRFQLQRSIRLLELLTFVNGPNVNAGRTIQIIRNQNISRCQNKILVQNQEPKDEIIVYELTDTLQGKELANPFIQAGDVVRVVDAEQAYVIGNVRSAAAINLNEVVTLTQALAMAGGVLPESNTEKIRLMRQARGSLNKTEIIVNLKNINKRLQEDVVLEPNDIVEVPGEGGAKKVLRDLLKTVTSTVTGLPTRVIR